VNAGTTECRIASSSEQGLVVFVDRSVYGLEAVKKAAYKFGDRFHILIEAQEDTRVKVTLKSKTPLNNADYLAGEFCNEVLDQELRESIAKETDAVRNLLLAHAFSKTSLLGKELEYADYHADSLGILAPGSREPTTTS